MNHIDLVLRPNLPARRLCGTCTITLTSIDRAVARIALDAVDLHVSGVCDAGGALAFEHRAGVLTVELRRPLAPRAQTSLTIEYVVEDPRRGLFFIEPDPATASGTAQCWTHGHAGGARYWLPCFDDPQQCATSTTTIEVAADLFALANGELIERRADETHGVTTYRYVQRVPHAAYLLSFVVGDFRELSFPGGSVAVVAYVPPGSEDAGRRTYGSTPAMLRALEAFTGVSYPFARYAQIAVSRFVFIGMENTAAATLSDEWLLEETHASPPVEALVVHELAHQWFGNFVRTAEWKDVWLNEGFATYCEGVWQEHAYGWSAYVYTVHEWVKAYAKEARDKYTRPIAANYFRDPIDVFDKHAYDKAGAVLHMLRGELGGERFARAVAHYARAGAGTQVEALDLVRAIEASTGCNMRFFFDQWIARAGHPSVRVRARFDPEQRVLDLRVSQLQRIAPDAPAYRFSLEVGIAMDAPIDDAHVASVAALPGERRVTLDVDCAEFRYSLALDRPPALVRIDPNGWVLGDMRTELGLTWACASQSHDPSPIVRIRAAQELLDDGSSAARAALGEALVNDAFWGVRREVATLLGTLCASWASSLLRRAIRDPDAQVRRAACNALGTARDRTSVDDLLALLAVEAASVVRGAALHALGRSRDRRVTATLVEALDTASLQDTVASGALAGLAELGGDEALAALETARGSRAATRRRSAARGFGILAVAQSRSRRIAVDGLCELLDDCDASVRLGAIEALNELGAHEAVAALRDMAAREAIPWIRSHADRAAERLACNDVSSSELAALRKRVDRLEADLRRVRDDAL